DVTPRPGWLTHAYMLSPGSQSREWRRHLHTLRTAVFLRQAKGAELKLRLTTHSRRAIGITSAVALCVALVPAAANAAAGSTQAQLSAPAHGEQMADYDARTAGTAKKILTARSALTPAVGLAASGASWTSTRSRPPRAE